MFEKDINKAQTVIKDCTFNNTPASVSPEAIKAYVAAARAAEENAHAIRAIAEGLHGGRLSSMLTINTQD